MRASLIPSAAAAVFAAIFCAPLAAQSTPITFDSALHWREIGPTRAGRARAVEGVPSQPGTFYAGYDDGGVWRTTDYGANWEPIFDAEPTGSIGAIAVSPSDPNVIYVGTGAGIIRPDLATGDGVYKSTDAGKTWTHLGLDNTQMIAMIDIDPKDPNRIFVAALGHPYSPNPDRGIYRSTDGGKTFEKVLYKDEYTSGNDVRIDPDHPNIVYAVLWQQQESFSENGASFGGSSGGIFKSTDGGTNWTQLTEGLPVVQQANLGISASNPDVIYAMVAEAAVPNAGGRGGFGAARGGTVGLFKSTDAGAHWAPVDPNPADRSTADNRPLARIGGGDLPTLAVDPKNPDELYSCSTVFWRSDDGGVTWTAVRGAPGGDDYQKTWINPDNTNLIVVVSDQGAVVSGNHGKSWSNWYTQPTAAMYHVSTDDGFPYSVCGGQQDSGSACVASRSNDGEITFHDWHPVNIQEYGEAAPDPRDATWVYGSGRTSVSLYNRTTGQTTQVGPDLGGRGGPGAPSFSRNVRTMPIEWSPIDHNTLYYASNAVWKTTDHAHSWTRISPDLARQTWPVPATTGKYGETVKPAPIGTITALSPSPRSISIIWAGTDDGNIQVTTDGGVKWTNVTPAAIKPWSRIFNLDAGHFSAATAYVAANTLRLDDMNPHFWRTHDGGRTWTEIDNGIAPGAPSNSIREDPHTPGLLYAATETQTWVSFDDGDHWQSLRLNMPAISVRDIELKDDSTCMCSDLIAGTHGRGYWILDDVTPLRAMAAIRKAQASGAAYLVKPATAIRVRYGTNDPTPWPPEVPAGENPPPGALIDYYLGGNASSPVTLDVLNATGHVIRSYTSADTVLNPDPARDPVAYNALCQRTPTAADCSVPLYWPAPSTALSSSAGLHRFSWDMKYDAVGPAGGGSGAVVPGHTYPSLNSPWVPPGQYTVRLTVDGKAYTQPITVRMDPRVTTSTVAIAQVSTLTRELRSDAQSAQTAYEQARGLAAELADASDNASTAFRARLDSLAPPPPAAGRGGRGGRGGFGGGRGRGGPTTAPSTLDGVSSALVAAAMPMQAADIAPTANDLNTITHARADYAAVMARWMAMKSTGLAALNVRRKAAGEPAIAMPQ